MRYAASKNIVTLKTGLGVVQGHWKRRRSIANNQSWLRTNNAAIKAIPCRLLIGRGPFSLSGYESTEPICWRDWPCCSWQMYDDIWSFHRVAENTNRLTLMSYSMTAKRDHSSACLPTAPPAESNIYSCNVNYHVSLSHVVCSNQLTKLYRHRHSC